MHPFIRQARLNGEVVFIVTLVKEDSLLFPEQEWLNEIDIATLLTPPHHVYNVATIRALVVRKTLQEWERKQVCYYEEQDSSYVLYTRQVFNSLDRAIAYSFAIKFLIATMKTEIDFLLNASTSTVSSLLDNINRQLAV